MASRDQKMCPFVEKGASQRDPRLLALFLPTNDRYIDDQLSSITTQEQWRVNVVDWSFTVPGSWAVSTTMPKKSPLEDIFKLYPSPGLGQCAASYGTSIFEKDMILITRQTVSNLFANFLEEIEKSISCAQEKLEYHEIKVDVVGLCGGGSLASSCIQPMINRISTAGKADISVVDPQKLTFQAHFATVLGNCIIWDQDEESEQARNTIFGIEKDGYIYWKLAEQTAMQAGSEYPIGWTVWFDFSTRSTSQIDHHLLAISKTSEALPTTFWMATHFSGFRSWKIQTTLSEPGILGLQSKRSCQICCPVVQYQKVVISCQDRVRKGS
ncbi:hypothetical protein BJ875DRAFT_456114 [Amylocarpus encephaloides]|uniref:Uncharacterized protein n=1 Tax=Amylocarpus encephaloides TaxID=45428 RepID=A0A9P7YMQ4_9HELO|nr:hypothetical protein BJ875DRAFT_456114 [Amylocarpus encephaloides]